ncbi:MAG: Holliday junction resolvase RuvX [Thermovirgaceae bacterium]|nr:Holliday junction resolvase RuvX [Thermovirgaceae bacterium]
MKRVLGLDIGKVRIGVALSDPLGTFAQGIAVLDAGRGWISALKDIVEANSVGMIVVGMPVRTDGSRGPETEWVESIIEKIRREFEGIEILTWDERFTTTVAVKSLIEGDVSRRRRKMVVDKVAASIMLQGFLENRRKGNGTS